MTVTVISFDGSLWLADMWESAVVVLAAACLLLLIEVAQIRRRLNAIADCAASFCEDEHG